jgi:hypothetical protein
MQVVVRGIDGLGNQLFRYAALRYYAKRYGAGMRIAFYPEPNNYCYGYPRPFLLSHFSIPVPMALRSVPDRLVITEKGWLKGPCLLLRGALRAQVFIEQRELIHSFLPDLPVERNVGTLYLLGFWQNRLTVEHVEDQLREDLRLKEPARGKNLEVLAQISQSNNPVSLHVRRGDYTHSDLNLALPLEYYFRAIATIKQRLVDPTFFVFSDDMPYVKENLSREGRMIFVEHNDHFSAHEDLRLMSACHHHIIANSTFSWWGAWLNPLPDKIVIAPKLWRCKTNTYYPDLLPPTWTLIEVPSGSFDMGVPKLRKLTPSTDEAPACRGVSAAGSRG